MKVNKESMLLYVVTDRTWLQEATLEEVVEKILASGATFLQLREKELSTENFLEEERKLKQLSNRYHIPFVINDNVSIALQCGADGVHIGQSDEDAFEVRRKIGPDKILGVSAQTVEQALKAQAQGADYIGVGAVFPTSTKENAREVTFDTLKQICDAISIPVVAIGGIHADNLLQLKGSQVDGVAVISAIFAAPDVSDATKELLTLSKEMVG